MITKGLSITNNIVKNIKQTCMADHLHPGWALFHRHWKWRPVHHILCLLPLISLWREDMKETNRWMRLTCQLTPYDYEPPHGTQWFCTGLFVARDFSCLLFCSHFPIQWAALGHRVHLVNLRLQRATPSPLLTIGRIFPHVANHLWQSRTKSHQAIPSGCD